MKATQEMIHRAFKEEAKLMYLHLHVEHNPPVVFMSDNLDKIKATFLKHIKELKMLQKEYAKLVKIDIDK